MGKEAAGWKDNVSSQKQRASHCKVFFSFFLTNPALITLSLSCTDLQVKKKVKGFSLIKNFNGFFFPSLKLVNGKVHLGEA